MLMFFSVPYDEGWSAFVNGEQVLIEKANIGFMAVRVPTGNAVIRFEYNTPGLIEGGYISLSAAAVFIVYLIAVRIIRRKRGIYDIPPMQFAENRAVFESDDKSREKSENRLESLGEIDEPQSDREEQEE